MVNFIGLGAQKAGTSWVYACLYEHPEICAPFKEIHFFSRKRFEEGREWYENHFSRCDTAEKKGEFSTSYLYSHEAPERIAKLYPEAKLIAILRNPINRAYSHYINMVKGGHIPKEMPFTTFQKQDHSVLDQGLYTRQLYRYFQYFSKKQMLILIYEDIEKDPAAFIKKIYQHLEVDPDFLPTMLHDKVNIARIPTWVGLEKWMHKVAEFMRKLHLDKLVWTVRKSGLPDYIRGVNTSSLSYTHESDKPVAHRDLLVEYFKKDVTELSQLLGRDLNTDWNIL